MTEETTENVESPIEPVVEKSESLVDKAALLADRIEQANTKTEELLKRQEALNVEAVLGGSAVAGTPVESDEDKAVKNVKDFLKGTGFEDQF